MTDARSALVAALSDRYRLERELGAGGMATVYLAEDLKHHRRVALKVLRPELSHALGPERFLREIETTAALHHPHILPLYDSGSAGDFLYYVMPYVEGESLRDRLNREKQLPVDDALQIAREVSDALSYAHSRGIIHRDIKPENIMLEGGHAMVADFGIARAVSAAGADSLTQTGMSVGTPAYMSPEQAAGQQDLDGRSDLYALGCVVYEMLAGQPPFTGPTVESVIRQHMAAEPRSITQFRPAVPPAIADVLQRALAKNPADRFSPVAQFADALRTGTTAAVVPPAAPTPQRIRVRSLIGGAVALGVVIAAGLFAMNRSGGDATGGTAPSNENPSLVVLPFTNMGGAPENEMFADGITEDVITRLATIGGLTVISRTTAMSYKGTTKPLKQVATELGVGALLEGSVRRIGSRVRVVAQLIDARTDAHLWANTFDRDLVDVFQIQSEVAQSIADTLRVTLSPAKRHQLAAQPTRDTLAYQIYLRGRAALAERTVASMREALELASRAIERDSGFALAYALRASVLYNLPFQRAMPERVAYPGARAALEQALALQPELPEARARLALLLLSQDYDRKGSEREMQRALADGAGSADFLGTYATVLGVWGRFDDAIRAAREAIRLDPQSTSALHTLASWQLAARQFDEALVTERRVTALTPDNQTAWQVRWQAAWRGGQVDEAIEAMTGLFAAARVQSIRPDELKQAFAAGGRPALTRLLLARWGDELSPGFRAMWFDELGQRDSAMAVLERAYQERWGGLLFLLRFHPMDGLRSDPRYMAFLRKVGLEP